MKKSNHTTHVCQNTPSNLAKKMAAAAAGFGLVCVWGGGRCILTYKYVLQHGEKKA